MKLERYRKLRDALDDHPVVIDVLLDEDFIPPHKQAAFVPYDAIIQFDTEQAFDGTDYSPDQIEDYLWIEDVEYNEVINIEEHEMSLDGDYVAYVSLETFEEYKSRW